MQKHRQLYQVSPDNSEFTYMSWNVLQKPPRHTAGFSLVELMVVVSIVSLISAMALPNMAIFKIKTARVELAQNSRYFHTLAESYIAENGAYPLAGFAYGIVDFGTYTETCGSNSLGFATTNCNKLRYHYIFYNATATTYSLAAWSFYWRDPGGEGESAGYGPVTSRCKVPDPNYYSVFYSDWWVMDQTGHLAPEGGAFGLDMLKACFG